MARPATRRTTTTATTRKATTTRKPKAAPSKRIASAKQKPQSRISAPAERDVTVYANKAPTEYHELFAQWIVDEVGYDPIEARNRMEAFRMGVSIATRARTAFMDSETLEDWRDANSMNKPGRKKKTEEEAASTESEEDEEYDEEEMEEEDEESDDDDYDDEDEDDDDDMEEDDEEPDDEEYDDEEDMEEDEEPPAPKSRVRGKTAVKTASRGSTHGTTRTTKDSKATPAPRGARKTTTGTKQATGKRSTSRVAF